MSLRDEINAAPRGTKAKLVKATGLNKLTIIRATAGTQCGAASAELIAEAFGAPDRWSELIVVRRRPRGHQDPPPSDDEPLPKAV
jgi:hypothetical protein